MYDYRVYYSRALGSFDGETVEHEQWSELIAAPNGEEARRMAERRRLTDPHITILEIRRI